MPFKRFGSQGFCQAGALWDRWAPHPWPNESRSFFSKLTLSRSTGCSPSFVQNRQRSGLLSPRYMGSPLPFSRVSRYWHGSNVTVTGDARAEIRVQSMLPKHHSKLEIKKKGLASLHVPHHSPPGSHRRPIWVTLSVRENQHLIDSKINLIDLSLLFGSLKRHRKQDFHHFLNLPLLGSPLFLLTLPMAVQACDCPAMLLQVRIANTRAEKWKAEDRPTTLTRGAATKGLGYSPGTVCSFLGTAVRISL